MARFTTLTVCGPLLTDEWIGGIKLTQHHLDMALFGLEITEHEVSHVLPRLGDCNDVTGEFIWQARKSRALMLYGDLAEDTAKKIFDAVDQMPKHGNLLLYAITAAYNPILPLLTGEPNARIPRSLAEFVQELAYPLCQRAWYMVYGEFLPDK